MKELLRFSDTGIERAIWQVGRFPIHCHANTGTSTWMIKEDKFLEWRRFHFTIDAELKSNLGHPIGLTGGVDTKYVCFALDHTRGSVRKRSNQEKIRTDDQTNQRQTGRVSDVAYAPTRTIPAHEQIERSEERRVGKECKRGVGKHT